MNETLPPFLQTIRSMGHEVFTSGDFNLNFIAIRFGDASAESFDDWITCWYKRDGQWHTHWWRATTDPGSYWMDNPMNVKGTAQVVPDQYRGLWKVGRHKTYKAFEQAGQVKVYRHQPGKERTSPPIDIGDFHINGHAADTDPWDTVDPNRTSVGRWSAGCQVWADSAGFREAIGLAEESIRRGYPNSFTYTLVKESDVL